MSIKKKEKKKKQAKWPGHQRKEVAGFVVN